MGAECGSDPDPESEIMIGRDIEEEAGAERERIKGHVAEAQRGENESHAAEAEKGGKEGPEAGKNEIGGLEVEAKKNDEEDLEVGTGSHQVERGEGVQGVEARKGGIERESALEAGVGAQRENQGQSLRPSYLVQFVFVCRDDKPDEKMEEEEPEKDEVEKVEKVKKQVCCRIFK